MINSRWITRWPELFAWPHRPSGPRRQQLMNALAADSEDRGDITETLGDITVEQGVGDFASNSLCMILGALGCPIGGFHSREHVADLGRPLDRDPPVERRFQVGRNRTQTQRRRFVLSVVPGQNPPVESCNGYRPHGCGRDGHKDQRYQPVSIAC